MSLQSRASLGFGFGAQSVAMLGYSAEQIEDHNIIGGGFSFKDYKGGLSTKFNKATKKKLKKVEELTEELQEIVEQEEQFKTDSLVLYESLIKDAIRKELNDEILLEINAEQYAKTKAIIEGIISSKENKLILEEEEAIAMIMMALLE